MTNPGTINSTKRLSYKLREKSYQLAERLVAPRREYAAGVAPYLLLLARRCGEVAPKARGLRFPVVLPVPGCLPAPALPFTALPE